MKPILVDQCDHYNSKTHNCNRCGRGLPDVCLEFEEMKRKAEAYERHNDILPKSVSGTETGKVVDESRSGLPLGPEQTQEPKKPRGRPRKVTSEANITD